MYAGLPPPADFSITSLAPFSVNFEMPKSISLTVSMSERKRQSVDRRGGGERERVRTED